MIRDWRDFKSYFQADMISSGVDPSIFTLIMNPLARFTFLMRLDEYLGNRHRIFLIRWPIHLWYRRLSIRLGFSFGPNVFGPGVAIVHYGTIVVNPDCRIGKNCRIHVGVHIGAAARADSEEFEDCAPRIGDNAYIGPGAKIYGPIHIGDNCVIGANAVVTRSFTQSGLTLAGIPARIIAEGGTGDMVLRGADTISPQPYRSSAG